jgi:signal transduction histidine kinase
MGRVIEEGRNTLHGLRSITTDSLDLEQAFSRIPQDFAGHNEVGAQIEFRVMIKGRPRPLHPIIRDEIYRIGREALIIAFRNPRTKNAGVELKYSARRLRLFVRDDGSASASRTPRSGREEPVELARLRERAGRIGARLKLRRLAPAGTEVEISIPSQVAFPNRFSLRPMKWLAGLSPLLKTIGRKK